MSRIILAAMNKNKTIFIFLISLFICGSFFAFDNFISANSSSHIIISEIQVSGETVYDEFIELYNPTNDDVDIEKFPLKLHIINSKGEDVDKKLVFISLNNVIKSHGYFLIASQKASEEYKDLISPDAFYGGTSLVSNGAVYISVSTKDKEGVIDLVEWGDANDFKGKSLERDGSSFKIRDRPNPQNSSFVYNEGEIDNNDNNGQDDSSQETGANDDDQNNDDADGQEQDDSTVLRDNGANDVIITEFLPDPEDSDRDNEFIEIYNSGNAEVNLSGWTIEDKIGSIKIFTISDGIKIGVGKYKAFYSDETKITLNNSGDGVVLKDNKNNIINETPTSGSVKEEQAYALDKNSFWVLTLRPTPGRENIIKEEENKIDKTKDSESDQKNNNDDEQDGSTLTHPNPSQEGSRENGASNYDFSDRIIISEIYPNSEGMDNKNGSYEWIELYNGSDRDVNLNGWMIDDILGKGSKSYLVGNEVVKAGSYKVFDAASTKIILNNTGDEVNLLWPDGTVVDKIKYGKADEGFSYNLSDEDKWFWSSEITPGKNNKAEAITVKDNLEQDFVFDDEDVEDIEYTEDIGDELEEIEYIEADLKDIKHFENYSRVKVSGTVSTPPGIFADNVFYLLGSGIQIYSYNIKIPKIELGDEVEIIGRVSEVGGEKRILLDNLEDVKVLSHNNLTEAQLVSTGNVNESVEGYLVMVEGKVSQIKKDVFYLDDGSGEIKIYIKPQTKIEKPEIEEGDWMVVIGQVSQTSLGYRVLPRFKGDIKLSKVSGVSIAQAYNISDSQENVEEKTENKNLLWNILFFTIVAIVLIGWRRVKVKNRK